MDAQDLAQRMYRRRHGRSADMSAGALMREDATVALIDLILAGLQNGDIQPDDLEAALDLARAGKLLKSSRHLAAQLAQYQREHFAVA